MKNDEVQAIIRWLNELAGIHESNMHIRGQMVERKHHRNACLWIARGIENREHLADG